MVKLSSTSHNLTMNTTTNNDIVFEQNTTIIAKVGYTGLTCLSGKKFFGDVVCSKISSSAGHFEIGSENEIKFYSDANGNNGGSDFVWYTTRTNGGMSQQLMRLDGPTGNVTMDGQSVSVNNLDVNVNLAVTGDLDVTGQIIGTINPYVIKNNSNSDQPIALFNISIPFQALPPAQLPMILPDSTLNVITQNPSTGLLKTRSINLTGDLNTTGKYELDGVTIMKSGDAIGTGGTNPYINCRVIQNVSTLADDGMYINYDSTGGTNADLRLYSGGTTTRLYIVVSTFYLKRS